MLGLVDGLSQWSVKGRRDLKDIGQQMKKYCFKIYFEKNYL